MPKTNNDKRIEEGAKDFAKRFTPVMQDLKILEDFDELEVMRVVNGKEIFEPLLLDDHTEKVITDFIIKALQQAKEEERKDCEKKIKAWLEDFTYADGFVGFTDKEWVAIKRFINLIQGGDNSVENKS